MHELNIIQSWKRSSTNTCNITDEPWKHYANWKKTESKDHILFDSIYMQFPE